MKNTACFRAWALFLFLLLHFVPLQAQWETDKQLHFAGGALYGLGGAGLGRQFSGGSRFWTFAGAVGGSAVVGLAKEWADDQQNPGSWNNGDLLATVAGGAFTGILLHLLLKPQSAGVALELYPSYEVESTDLRRFKQPPGFALIAAPPDIQKRLIAAPSP